MTAQITGSPKALLQALFADDPVLYQKADIVELVRGFNLRQADVVIVNYSTYYPLVELIREVRRGGAPMTGAIARKILTTFHKPEPAAATAASADAHLSQREQSILNLLAQGQSNKEIAEHLKLSVETVCWNLKRIYRKLHVQSRTQAMLKYRPTQA